MSLLLMTPLVPTDDVRPIYLLVLLLTAILAYGVAAKLSAA